MTVTVTFCETGAVMLGVIVTEPCSVTLLSPLIV